MDVLMLLGWGGTNLHMVALERDHRCFVLLLFWWDRDEPVTEFSLKVHTSSKDLKPAIDRIVQKGGLSNVGE